ncbi:Cdc73p PWA37_002685 [Arxiozyma heterogenica]|uniref:Cell division control protein 73 C-terminal domain-containing protein n=1 Tax=Arxiozyma heterogenica TaxID=278026 RepID=A0AAN7WKW7_9SACH|nr:hypothetical protein RI543_002110 [Kazachstania heterogenica]
MIENILNVLRNHLIKNEKIKLLDENNEVVDDITKAKYAVLVKNDNDNNNADDSIDYGKLEKFDLSKETNFSIDGNNMELRVVIHCFLHKDSSSTDYLADCQNKNLINVSFLQRNDLNGWLSGQLETSQYLSSTTNGDINANADETKADKINTDRTKDDDDNNNNNLHKVIVESGNNPSSGVKTEQSLEDNLEKEDITDDIKSDLLLNEVLKHERRLLDHNSGLRGTKSIDFGYLIKDVELKLVQNIKSSLRNKAGRHGHISKNVSSNSRKKYIQHKDPIILIPSAASSIITISNIKPFLQECKYINPRELSSSLRDDLVTIEKKFDKINKTIRFLVVNNTRMFTKPEYWDRVVAVFTTGHIWQFNNYQWNTPQELFQHCKGYYFYFNGDVIPQHVQQWNVERVELDRNRRFKDVEIVRYFWNNLEQELLSRGYH